MKHSNPASSEKGEILRYIKINQPFLGLIKVGCYVWCSGNLDLYERDLGPAKIKAGG